MIDFYLVDGKPMPLPERVAERAGHAVATDAEIGRAMRAALPGRQPAKAKPGKRPKSPCPRCPKGSPPSAVARVRWLRIEWLGEPWPKRLRLRSPVHVIPAPGCGCIARLKRWVEARRLRRFARRR